jgi:hypothetical protein
MLATTFLGHQGWMFRSQRANVLLDPLIAESFGAAQALGYDVYPPRLARWELCPPVSAVVLSHEHDDHFDIPSLARLDRDIPIYLSARSSVAAFTLLREMGFSVEPLVPGVPVAVEDLEIHPFAGDHATADSGDEWDALALVVREQATGGSFFTAIDLVVTSRLIEAARGAARRPSLVGWTNNTIDRSFMTDFQPELSGATQSFADSLIKAEHALEKLWGTPAALLICGGGFAFSGERSYLNHHLFCVDTDEVAHRVRAEVGTACFAPHPGHTFFVEGEQLREVKEGCEFLSTAPPSSWPAREKRAMHTPPDYGPASGRREMTTQEVELLLERLQELADALVGGRLFRSLYSLSHADLPAMRLTFALVLRHGDRAGVFEYNPNACRFERSGSALPRTAYLAGLECWATDLLAVLGGELAPIAISFGRARLWNAAPAQFDFCLLSELYRVSHPLRRPAAFLENYRRAFRLWAEVVHVVRPASRT